MLEIQKKVPSSSNSDDTAITLLSHCAGLVVTNLGLPPGFGTDAVTDKRVIEYVLKNYTLRKKMDIFNILHTKIMYLLTYVRMNITE
jgi:hypothetical protein